MQTPAQPTAPEHPGGFFRPRPRFTTPTLYVTPGALAVLGSCRTPPLTLIMRHFAGEWNGQPDNAERNEEYLREGAGMLLSIFEVGMGVATVRTVWVISHIGTADDYTTVLLPSEY